MTELELSVIAVHLPNFPENKFTPRIQNMSQKMRQTSKTFRMVGMAPMRALTTTLRKQSRREI